jgi:3-hydroxyisobutyrate dehydrogenase-like beta-hydroxyacid dehydrogenase
MVDDARIGWIGTGKMGSAMCLRVLAQQIGVIVLEPRPENRREVVAAGAVAIETAADLASQVDLIFLTLPDDSVLRSVVLHPERGLAVILSSRHTVVEMSTVSPGISEEVATALSARGVGYLRAPMSGSTTTAAAGGLTVFASGPKAALERAEPVLRSFAGRLMYVGEAEESRYLKLLINSMVAASSALLAEALALGRAGNLSTAMMMDAILESVIASPLLKYKKDMVVAGDYAPAFELSQMLKDLDLALDAGREGGVRTQVLSAIRERYRAAAAAGLGSRDFFALAGSMATEPS